MRIGYIGLGSQGAGIAEMIAKSEHDLVVWARRPGVTDAFVSLGAKVAESPAALAAQCDLVGLCVMADKDVEEMVYDRGILAAMKPGAVLVIQSTVRPQTVREIARSAERYGVDVIDAPVSGSSKGARAHTLLVMTGGTKEACAKAQPMFDTCAGKVIYCGGLGNGQIAKLVNNGLFIASLEVVHDAFEIGDGVGISREVLREVLLAGSARSYALEQSDRIFDSRMAAHISPLFLKDVDLLAEITKADGIDTGVIDGLGRATVATVATYIKRE